MFLSLPLASPSSLLSLLSFVHTSGPRGLNRIRKNVDSSFPCRAGRFLLIFRPVYPKPVYFVAPFAGPTPGCPSRNQASSTGNHNVRFSVPSDPHIYTSHLQHDLCELFPLNIHSFGYVFLPNPLMLERPLLPMRPQPPLPLKRLCKHQGEISILAFVPFKCAHKQFTLAI